MSSDLTSHQQLGSHRQDLVLKSHSKDRRSSRSFLRIEAGIKKLSLCLDNNMLYPGSLLLFYKLSLHLDNELYCGLRFALIALSYPLFLSRYILSKKSRELCKLEFSN